MMRKFEVGDIVVGNEDSKVYIYTSKEQNFVGKVVGYDDDGEVRVEILECGFSDRIGTIYTVDPEHFELKEPEIEIGDKVRVRRDVTVDELDTLPYAISDMFSAIIDGHILTVSKIFDDYIDVEENGWGWRPDWLEIVEKAPKIEYFDARKSENFPFTSLSDEEKMVFIKFHGMEKSEANKNHPYGSDWNEYMFVEEKPEPLKIIDGKVL